MGPAPVLGRFRLVSRSGVLLEGSDRIAEVLLGPLVLLKLLVSFERSANDCWVDAERTRNLAVAFFELVQRQNLSTLI